MTSKVVAGFGAVLLAWSVAASAQSLGAVAQQEEARRKEVKAPAKVYTNDSLRPEPGSSTPSASSTATPSNDKSGASADKSASDKTAADKAGDKAAADQGDKSAAKDDGAKDESYWRKKVTDARTALDRSQSFAEALQTRINALTTDFTNEADPAHRAVIANDRDKALAQLTELKKEIETNTKAIADIQEDARKAGVPAGWVR